MIDNLTVHLKVTNRGIRLNKDKSRYLALSSSDCEVRSESSPLYLRIVVLVDLTDAVFLKYFRLSLQREYSPKIKVSIGWSRIKFDKDSY